MMASSRTRNWGMIVGGICLAILGFILLLSPGLTLVFVAIYAGCGFLVVGAIDIFSYALYRNTLNLSGWALAYGIGDVILGLIFVAHPLATAVVIPWLAGIFVTAFGIFSIATAISLRGMPGSGWVWFNAIVSIICGLSFFFFPAVFAYFLAFFLIFRGISLAAFGINGENTPPTPYFNRYRP